MKKIKEFLNETITENESVKKILLKRLISALILTIILILIFKKFNKTIITVLTLANEINIFDLFVIVFPLILVIFEMIGLGIIIIKSTKNK